MRKYLLILSAFFSIVCGAQTPQSFLITKAAGASCVIGDADAQKFIDSVQLTTPLTCPQKKIIDTLVTMLKDSSLWSKLSAVYPVIGGAENSCKWNLKDPATYKIVFNGGWSFTASGADPNGSTGYANTGVGMDVLSVYDRHWSVYYTEHSTSDGYDGAFNGSLAFGIQAYDATGKLTHGLNTLAASAYSNTSTIGYYIGSITGNGANLGVVYKAGVSVATATPGATPSTAINYFLGALSSSGTAILFHDRNISFASLGSGLTAGEAATLNNIVQHYETAIGR